MHSIKFSKQDDPDEIGKSIGLKIAKTIALVIGGCVAAVFIGFFFGWLLKYLWNETIATMFDLTPISYWQAVGLFILAKLLFGFGGHGGGHDAGKKDKKQKERGWGREWWREKPAAGSDPADDDTLQQYWREEGRAAYEAYVAARKAGGEGAPQSKQMSPED